MNQELKEGYTKYEVARILGARSLQLAMDAPILLKLSEEELDELNFDVLKIAEKEFNASVLPITIKRPLPKKSEKEIKKLSDIEIKERLEIRARKEKKEMEKLEEKKEEFEEIEEKEIMEQGEIMEIAKPDDEDDVVDEEDNERENY